MSELTPAELCTKLEIQPSTLRKYSALLEKEQITFKRSNKNARLYNDSEIIAIELIIATMKEGKLPLEDAISSAAKQLKGVKNIDDDNIATDTGATVATNGRYSDNIADDMLAEIKSMKAQLKEQEDRQKERDALFVEVLEGLQNEVRTLKEQTAALPTLPEPEQQEAAAAAETSPQHQEKDSRSLWARIWNK